MLRDYLPQQITARLILTFVLVFAITAAVAYLIGGTSTLYMPALGAATLITLLEYSRFKKERQGHAPVR